MRGRGREDLAEFSQRGKLAPFHAAERADQLLETGYLDGERVWLRILKAVEELLAKRPAPGQKVH